MVPNLSRPRGLRVYCPHSTATWATCDNGGSTTALCGGNCPWESSGRSYSTPRATPVASPSYRKGRTQSFWKSKERIRFWNSKQSSFDKASRTPLSENRTSRGAVNSWPSALRRFAATS